MAQPARPGRNRLDRAQAVADRLLARNIGEGAQDGAEKAGRLAGHCAIVVHPGLGIEIDKAPVHLAMRRPLAQGGQRRAKGPVVEHGAIDQVDAFRVRAAGQHPIDEGLPPRPVFAAAGEHVVDLGNSCRREGAGKARRGAGRKHQIRRRAEVPLRAVAGAGKADHQAVLGLGHFFRRVQPQALGGAVIIGDRHEQIERVQPRHQRRRAFALLHRVKGIGQQARERRTGKRRLEPAAAHETGQLALHLRVRRDLGLVFILQAAPAHPPHQRDRPQLRQRPRCRRLVEQHVAVCAVQPQAADGIEIMAFDQRPGQQHPVDAAG